jgi:hypothetical protein
MPLGQSSISVILTLYNQFKNALPSIMIKHGIIFWGYSSNSEIFHLQKTIIRITDRAQPRI